MSRKARAIHNFHGGLHLPDHKAESNHRPIGPIPFPPELILPLQQHIGKAAEPVVAVGERVLKGQVIARATDYISAQLHAPTSGTLVAIEPRPVPHPSGLASPCMVIACDGEDRWAELPPPLPHFAGLDPAELRERIRWAGVVGLGGAGFPTSVKANPGPQRTIETLIINGAECEPYITCDDRLMRERPDQIVAGIAVLMHLIGARECLVGIEDNKPEAIAALREALAGAGLARARVVVVPSKYPSGGEKQLIYLLTGREVPSQGIPAEIGIVCQNVATTAAIAAAVLEGRPLISRIVTVTGRGVVTPQNFEVPLGTPAAHLIAQAGGYLPSAARLILGGPMMGFAVHDDGVPVTKAANCFLVEDAADLEGEIQPRACIRCGACAEVCPVSLLPQQIYWHARSKDLDKSQDYHLFDCIECGCCAYVCPSRIPLVQYYRYAKTEIWAQERDKRKADLARRRHEARITRLERLEAERKARLRKKRQALETPGPGQSGEQDPKKAAIQAAMQRVAAKKAAQAATADGAGAAGGRRRRTAADAAGEAERREP
jgi:electron transport complex protein RnfC